MRGTGVVTMGEVRDPALEHSVASGIPSPCSDSTLLAFSES
jgi:hypothetical protein